jgi:hypothetical protein
VFGACDPRTGDSDGASDADFYVDVLLLGCVFISTVCSVLILNLVTYFVRMADLLPDQVFRPDVNAVGFILVD